MLVSSKIQLIIPVLFFISLQNDRIRAENDLPYNLEIPPLLTTSEMAGQIMNQNLNLNCVNLRAFFNSKTFQEVEKILNMTVDSTEVNDNREEYHSRIKRCSEIEKQNRILREFERHNRRKESIDNRKSDRSYLQQKNSKNTDILKTTLHDFVPLVNVDKDARSDDNLRGDLAQAMTDATDAEINSRTYRTLPGNLELFTNPLPNTSAGKNAYLNNQVKKKPKTSKEHQGVMGDSSQRNSFSHDSKLTTKSLGNGENTKKGMLKSLFEKIHDTMEGGHLKNTEDTTNFNSNERSSFNDNFSDGDLTEFETVTSHTLFNNFNRVTTANQRSKNEENGTTGTVDFPSTANSEIIPGMHEEARKQLQAKVEDLILLRTKLLEIIRMANSAKNQTKISIPLIKNKNKMKETTKKEIVFDENFKTNNSHSKRIRQKSKTETKHFDVNLSSKNGTSLAHNSIYKANDLKITSNEPQKHHSVSFSPPDFTNSTIKAISKNSPYRKKVSFFKTQTPLNQIKLLDHYTTQLPSLESHPLKHSSNHDRHLSINLQDADLSQNQNPDDMSFSARSQDVEITNKDGKMDLNFKNASSPTKLRLNFLKTTPSTQAQDTEQAFTKKEASILRDSTKRFKSDDNAVGSLSSTMRSAEEARLVKELPSLPQESVGIGITEIEKQSATDITQENKNIPNVTIKHKKISVQYSTTPILSFMKSERTTDSSHEISSTQLWHQNNKTFSNTPTSKQNLLLREKEPEVLFQTPHTLQLDKTINSQYDDPTFSNARVHIETQNSASGSSYFKKVTTLHASHHEMHPKETSSQGTTTLKSTHISGKSTDKPIIYSKEESTAWENFSRPIESSDWHLSKEQEPKFIFGTSERPKYKKKAISQQENLSGGRNIPLIRDFAKIATNQPTQRAEPEMSSKKSIMTESQQLNRNSLRFLNEDEVSSEQVGKIQQSISNEPRQVDNPVTTSKPIISSHLEKFKQQGWDKISTTQPLDLDKDIVSKMNSSHEPQSNNIPSPHYTHSPHLLHFDEISKHPIQPSDEFDESAMKATLSHTEGSLSIQPGHQHLQSHNLNKMSTIQSSLSVEKSLSRVIPQVAHHYIESPHLDKLSTIQPPQSVGKSMSEVILLKKPHTENHIIPQPDHHHISNFQPFHSVEKSNSEFTLTPKPHTENYMIPTLQSSHSVENSNSKVILSPKTHPENYLTSHSVHHHIQPSNLHKLSAFKPPHSIEKSMNAIKPHTEDQENALNSHSIHSHLHSKYFNKISTPEPRRHNEGLTLPMKSYLESLSMPQPIAHNHHPHRHPDGINLESSPTLQPPHSEKSSKVGDTSSHEPDKIYPKATTSSHLYLTSLPIHLLTGQAKTLHQNNASTILKEIARLEKMKIEEIKNLIKKYMEDVHKLQQNDLSQRSASDADWFHKQHGTKTHVTDSASLYTQDNHQHKAEGRSESEQDIEIYRSTNISTPSLTDSSTTAILQDDQQILGKIPLPLPPLNPNDNWKYVTKLDRYYEKQQKSTTPKLPPKIRLPSETPSPQPQITPRPLAIPSFTITPTTEAPRLRPFQPSRDATVPKKQPSSTGALPTQKPPPPVNYDIKSTINRNYNITINLVTPDSVPHENTEEDQDEPENNDPITMDEPNPITNLALPTVLIKIEEPAKDFESLSRPSLIRQLSPQLSNSSNLQTVNETTSSLSSSTIPNQRNQPTFFLETKIDPNEESSQAAGILENKDTILQSSIPTTLPSSTVATPPYQNIINNLKSITMRVQSQLNFEPIDHSTANPSTIVSTANKTNPTSTHTLCSDTNFVQRGCNNIIIIPNKTEEIMEILRLLNMVNISDQAPLSNPSPTSSSPMSASSDWEPHSNPFSDIKSILASIQKSKLTPSESMELRKSIGDLLAALKQRRSNEYTRLYLSKVNPMVGDSRDSIQAITQINEYIELLELMLVYLARDPDKLLDERQDARFDNFESPYPKDDPQRRLIEDQFYYVHPKILNEFIDVYKKYSKDETYYGTPIWQFSQENEPSRRSSRQRTLSSSLNNLFRLKDLVIPATTYNRAPMNRPDMQYFDYRN